MEEKLTLDTSLLQEYWKEQDKKDIVEQVLALADSSAVDLAVTRYIRDDIPNDPLASRIDELPRLKVAETGGVFTLNLSALDGPDGLGSQEFLDFQAAIPADWKPKRGERPDGRDWLHLHAHFIQGRDVFLTWDEGVLELGEMLASNGFRIRVMRPEDYLARRNGKTDRQVPVMDRTWDGLPRAQERPYACCVVVWREGENGREFLLLHRLAPGGASYEGDWAWTPPSGSASQVKTRRRQRHGNCMRRRVSPCPSPLSEFLRAPRMWGSSWHRLRETQRWCWMPNTTGSSGCLWRTPSASAFHQKWRGVLPKPLQPFEPRRHERPSSP